MIVGDDDIYCVFGTVLLSTISCFFFFNDTATTEIYTLSLHDALPISSGQEVRKEMIPFAERVTGLRVIAVASPHPESLLLVVRSEEHTSELQSRQYLVCRLLLEKKKKNTLTE